MATQSSHRNFDPVRGYRVRKGTPTLPRHKPKQRDKQMKRFGTVLVMIVCSAIGFASGYKTALLREHNRLEHNKQIISRMLKDVWSNRDTNSAMKVADELFTSDFVLHDWTGDSRGLEIHKKGIADNRLINPDWNEQPLEMIAEG